MSRLPINLTGEKVLRTLPFESIFTLCDSAMFIRPLSKAYIVMGHLPILSYGRAFDRHFQYTIRVSHPIGCIARAERVILALIPWKYSMRRMAEMFGGVSFSIIAQLQFAPYSVIQ